MPIYFARSIFDIHYNYRLCTVVKVYRKSLPSMMVTVISVWTDFE